MDMECKMCGGIVAIPNDVIKGEILSCPDCGLDFEVGSDEKGSLILVPAEKIKEDWGE